MTKQYGWHFTGTKLRDGSPIPEDGEWLEVTGEIRICERGLHGSRTPFDALRYAPGSILCYCEFEGIVTEQKNKFVAHRRKVIARGDSTEALLYFARQQALSVIHLWDAPQVVCDYLMGDDTARAAAWYAAWDAAWDAAQDAERAAARAAARDTAWAAARAEFNSLIYECFEDVLEDCK